jgi:hypothetical protein
MTSNNINPHCTCAFCIKPKWITKEDFITEAATFLGYPKCCTAAFIENMKANKHVFGDTDEIVGDGKYVNTPLNVPVPAGVVTVIGTAVFV